jgi:hypothetical protein
VYAYSRFLKEGDIENCGLHNARMSVTQLLMQQEKINR